MAELKIAEVILRERKRQKLTQEELANALTVTPQAVSNWERGGYPDITLLPKIANYFKITMDELFGSDEGAQQIRIEEIVAEYNRLRHHIPLSPDHNLDKGIQLIRKALIEYPGNFFFEQLLGADLYQKGKGSSDVAEKIALFEEAISLCEDILARSTEDRWRSSAKQILLVLYADLGVTEKALEMACQMPNPHTTCEYMLTYILKGEELQERLKMNAVLYYQIFRESILWLSEGGLSLNNMVQDHELETAGIERGEYVSAIEQVLKYHE